MSQITTIGDRVKLKENNLVGCVRFIGEIKNKSGIYYGVELDEAKGKNDGSIGRINYFRTAPKRGLFIKQSQILKTNSKNNPDVPRVTVGDNVYIKKFDCNGIIRYIGSADFRSKTAKNHRSKSITAYTKKEIDNARPQTPTSPASLCSKYAAFALSNIWYGVELEQAKGKNNGTVQNKWYFDCEPKYGSFVRKEQIQLESHDAEEKQAECSTPNGTQSRLKFMNAWNWRRNKQIDKENVDGNIQKKEDSHLKLKKQGHGRQRSRSLDLSAMMINEQNNAKKSKKSKTKKKEPNLERPQSAKSGRKKRGDTKKKGSKARSKSVAQRKDFKPKSTAKSRTETKKAHKKKSGSDVSHLSPPQKKKKKKGKKKRVRIQGFEQKEEEKEKGTGGRIEVVFGDAAEEKSEKGEKDDDEKYVTITDYNTDCGKEDKLFIVGDRVKLSGDDELLGTLMFIGPVRNKEGIFYGVDLDEAQKGKNDGTFRKKRYFYTKSGTKSGLFVKKERILRTVRKNKRIKQRVCVSDVVYIDKFECNGTIRFIGNTSFKPGVIWYGIELNEAKGKNNGSVRDEWYFECEDKHGTFVKNSAFSVIPKKDMNTLQSFEFDRSASNRSNLSVDSELSQTPSIMSSTDSIDSFGRPVKVSHDNIIMDILMTENDLAGFCLIWMVGLFYVIILRANEHEFVVETRWISIFGIPCTVGLFTWIFSYIITKYTNRTGQESMAIPIFYIPFFCKLLVAMIFFGRSAKDIRYRYKDTEGYSAGCTCSLAIIWFDCVLSVATSEILITTVMVNSIQNIDQSRLRQENKSVIINTFLFITRPILWVYNRLIVMFISFYLYYYLLFALGPMTLYICPLEDIHSLRDIGISTLLLPFHDMFYLFDFKMWTKFTLSQYADNTHARFAVIQQVLVFTTGADLILDIWSIYQLFKDIRSQSFDKREKGNEIQLFHVKPNLPAHQLSVIEEEKLKRD